MRKDYHFYVYILSSRSRTLYIGITNSLLRRVHQHREGNANSFTAKYRIHRLVYFENFTYVDNAIDREKQLKGWLREKKLALISASNPTWNDLYPNWSPNCPSTQTRTPNPPQINCHPERSEGPASALGAAPNFRIASCAKRRICFCL